MDLEIDKRERTVIHLQMDEKHEYFGSLAGLYEFHTAEDLGITYGALRNYSLSPNKPYVNSKCIIRKGTLKQKKGNRGGKNSSINNNM